MTFDEFDLNQSQLFQLIKEISRTKGKEYANGENRFGNFNRLAEKYDVPNYLIGAILFTKHLDSIEYFIKNRCSVSLSEPIQGRFADAINYLSLIYGMIEEEMQKRVYTSSIMHDGDLGSRSTKMMISNPTCVCGHFMTLHAAPSSGGTFHCTRCECQSFNFAAY